jgi:hypothetical protein
MDQNIVALHATNGMLDKRRFSQGKIGSHSPPPPPVFFEDLAPFCEWIFLPPELDCHALIPV